MGADDEVCAVVMVEADGVEVVLGRVAGRRPDLVLVDTLARLQLAALKRGCSIRLHEPCEELCELLRLVGLTDLLGSSRLPLDAGWEAEGGE